MIFRVGQKVVCVDDGNHPRRAQWSKLGRIRVGEVFTVRDVGLTLADEPGIRLQERRNTGDPDMVHWHTRKPYKDCFYRANRFRPVVEKKPDTGFAILEEIRDRETEPARPKKPALSSTV